jgi:hypothetical protein
MTLIFAKFLLKVPQTYAFSSQKRAGSLSKRSGRTLPTPYSRAYGIRPRVFTMAQCSARRPRA